MEMNHRRFYDARMSVVREVIESQASNGREWLRLPEGAAHLSDSGEIRLHEGSIIFFLMRGLSIANRTLQLVYNPKLTTEDAANLGQNDVEWGRIEVTDLGNGWHLVETY